MSNNRNVRKENAQKKQTNKQKKKKKNSLTNYILDLYRERHQI